MDNLLQKEIQRLKTILNNVPAGIEVYDRMGNILQINQKGLEIFGVEDSQIVIGVNILDNPNLPNIVLSNISTLFSLPDKYKKEFANEHFKNSFSVEYSFERVKSKNYFPSKFTNKNIFLSSKIECYFNEKGDFENLIFIFLDESERYQKQLEIKKFELMFDNMSTLAKIGIMEENLTDGTFVANEQWFENFGVSKDIDQRIDDIYKNLVKQDKQWLKSNYLRIPYASKPLKIVKERQLNVIVDGKNRWIKCIWTIFEDEFGDTIILGSSIDVTEFVDATLKAKESEQLKTKFLKNITHEIHTPLNAIIGFSQLLVDSNDIEEKIEYRKIISENNEILLNLFNNILEYSKMEAGIMSLKIELFDICALAHDIFDVYNSQNIKRLECNFKYEGQEVYIFSDKRKIKDIITNLLNNAFKFTNEGFVELSVDDIGENVRIGVKDSGIGIGEPKQKQIFERFYKLNDFAQGSGLGLSIAYKLVKLIGGELKINSELGKGSEFYFTLPKKRDTI
ncbi:MAG: two-component system sensor histidine kinase [Bacteroidetes bacterium]|nr:two-component system sensor histidine kinase [Bacteroidota bacterium]